MPNRLPVDLPMRVKMAKQMAREELGLPESEKRFGMRLTSDGIRLTHKKCPDVVVDYTWHEVELEIVAMDIINNI